MVNHPAARLKFHRGYVAVRSRGNRDDEIVVNIFAIRWKSVRAGLDDKIGLTKLPATVPLGNGRKVCGIAFRNPGRNPFLNKRKIMSAQTPLPFEFAIALLGKPRWHDLFCGDFADVPRMFVCGGES